MIRCIVKDEYWNKRIIEGNIRFVLCLLLPRSDGALFGAARDGSDTLEGTLYALNIRFGFGGFRQSIPSRGASLFTRLLGWVGSLALSNHASA